MGKSKRTVLSSYNIILHNSMHVWEVGVSGVKCIVNGDVNQRLPPIIISIIIITQRKVLSSKSNAKYICHVKTSSSCLL